MVGRLILVISGIYKGLYGVVASSEGFRIKIRVTLQAGEKFPSFVTVGIDELKFID